MIPLSTRRWKCYDLCSMKTIKLTILAAINQLVSSQNINEVLSQYSQLSSLTSIITNSSALFTQLEAANNFTFLAPSNDAIATWTRSPSSNTSIDILLTYHLLTGSLLLSPPVKGWYNVSIFMSSALNDTRYTNVTGGQRVEFLFDGQAKFQSGDKTTSIITAADIISTGGIIHIIDTVLEIPLNSLREASAARLEYFDEVFTSGYFLHPENAAESALANLPSERNQSQVNVLLEYHIVIGLYYSSDFINGSTLNTTAGVPILVTIDNDGDIYLNAAKITTPDYLVSNGVMHVIDR
ncbi:FAS1 domain-containing protein [Viridothelium virens]|uniref:FAS1 domain-containing protein n=1 Tax=Viridothelium virens TaxID=1048519 RepID=A0A6A6HC95_VIRVR|nr:FAS1 domain-containing protein [Viridothelium virens]